VPEPSLCGITRGYGIPTSERILPFLDITGIHAGEGNSNPNVARVGLGVFHVADDEYISRCALLFVPSGFHSSDDTLARQSASVPDLKIRIASALALE